MYHFVLQIKFHKILCRNTYFYYFDELILLLVSRYLQYTNGHLDVTIYNKIITINTK